MGLELPAKGALERPGDRARRWRAARHVTVRRQVMKSAPGPDGIQTILDYQTVGETRYFDAAGFDGKTVGLTAQ